MSDIDRIAEKHLEGITSLSGSQIRKAMRAALLEYGAIVREECAKKAIAETVRRISNAHQD